MTEPPCTRLSERIPEVARGRAEWSAGENEHLSACAACRAEWQLAQTAQRLARRAEALIAPDRVAEGVMRRLAESPARGIGRRLRWVGVTVAAAAAILLVVRITSTPAPDAVPVVASASSDGLFLPGLDSLTVEELKSVLVSIDQPIEAVSTIDAYEWQSLDDHELERLLREWEG